MHGLLGFFRVNENNLILVFGIFKRQNGVARVTGRVRLYLVLWRS